MAAAKGQDHALWFTFKKEMPYNQNRKTQTNVFISCGYWGQFWHRISFSVFDYYYIMCVGVWFQTDYSLFIMIIYEVTVRKIDHFIILLSWGSELEANHLVLCILIWSKRVLIGKPTDFHTMQISQTEKLLESLEYETVASRS